MSGEDHIDSIPSADCIRRELASARRRNGLPMEENTVKRNVKFIRTMYKRRVLDDLSDPKRLQEKLRSEFPSPSTRCVYARALQTYLTCTSQEWSSHDGIIRGLQQLITESYLEGKQQ